MARKPPKDYSKLHPDSALSKAEVCEFLNISKATFDRRRKTDPAFPQPFRHGSLQRWRFGDVVAYQKRQA